MAVGKSSENAKGRRTTIYRLTGVDDFREAVRAKYLDHDGFDVDDVTIGDRPALLVTGAMTKDSAAWGAPVTASTGRDVAIPGLFYTSPSPRDRTSARMPSSA